MVPNSCSSKRGPPGGGAPAGFAPQCHWPLAGHLRRGRSGCSDTSRLCAGQQTRLPHAGGARQSGAGPPPSGRLRLICGPAPMGTADPWRGSQVQDARYTIVWTRFRAKLEVPRPSHTKNPEASPAFQATCQEHLQHFIPPDGYSPDPGASQEIESRIGLLTVRQRRAYLATGQPLGLRASLGTCCRHANKVEGQTYSVKPYDKHDDRGPRVSPQ